MSAMKIERDPYKADVGRRLKVTAREFGFPTTASLARNLHEERNTVDAWFNGRALPPVQSMIKFCSQFGLTLDWIYKHDLSGLNLADNIRLKAAMEGDAVPPASRRAVAGDEPPQADESVPVEEKVSVQRRVHQKSKASEKR